MNNSEAQNWLDDTWATVLESELGDSDSEIDRLVNSGTVSIRYAIFTQMLGKIADNNRNLLILQAKTGEDKGAWDARTFCKEVIIPWVADNYDVLGKSPDPYVNNPLRRSRLDEEMQKLRNKTEWDALVAFLSPLNSVSQNELEAAFIRCLKSAARRLGSQSFRYQIPIRVSSPQMFHTIESFLARPSGGLRPLAVTSAMATVLGRAFSIFAEVLSQGLNEADFSTGAPGDVMCLDSDGKMVLVIEVKDRALTLADVRGSTQKARASSDPLSNLLFAAPSILENEQDAVRESMKKAWASGLNISQIDIMDLAHASFALLSEEWRPRLLHEIGEELDRRGDHTHRRAWYDLLSNIAENDTS